MKTKIKRAGKDILFFLLRCLWLFPVNRKKVVFTSMEGAQYSCNPKYISEALHGKHPELEIVWLVKPENSQISVPDYVKKIKFDWLNRVIQEMTAGIVVTNQNVLGYIPFRSKQLVINTWHGGGAYKKVHGRVDTYQMCADRTTFVLSSSQAFSDVLKTDFCYSDEKIVTSGMPRNDILLNYDCAFWEKIRKKIGVRAESFVVLYAPTFRRNEDGVVLWKMDMDFSMVQEELEKKFGRKCEILVRAHVGDDVFARHKVEIRDVSGYDDMQELLCITDLLITDYSSCVWDRAVQKGMSILYATDVDMYRRYPGLYTDISTWPFPLAQNNEELKQELRKLDSKKQAESCEKHLQELGSYETGYATEQVVKIIEKYLKGNQW